MHRPGQCFQFLTQRQQIFGADLPERAVPQIRDGVHRRPDQLFGVVGIDESGCPRIHHFIGGHPQPTPKEASFRATPGHRLVTIFGARNQTNKYLLCRSGQRS
jgi:hypothetical protein